MKKSEESIKQSEHAKLLALTLRWLRDFVPEDNDMNEVQSWCKNWD